MPLAERLSSKFHSCPQGFASQPTELTVLFLNKLSAFQGIILQYTSYLKRFIYYKIALEERKYPIFLNKWNIAQLTKVVYPESHLVVSLMDYAFHRVNVSSIWEV